MSQDGITKHVDVEKGFAKMAADYTEAFPQFRDFAQYSINAAPALTSDSIVHDNACGPGAVSSTIIAKFKGSGDAPPKLIATDANPAMIAEAKKQNPGLDARVMDSKKLDLEDTTFTHSFTNFLLNPIFTHDDNVAFAKNIRRTLAPGGTAVMAVWYQLEWLSMLRDAADASKAGGAEFVPRNDFPQNKVRAILVEAGFASDAITFESREALGEPVKPGPSREQMDIVAGMFGGMITASWSDEEKKTWAVKVKERFDRAMEEEERHDMAAWIVTAKA